MRLAGRVLVALILTAAGVAFALFSHAVLRNLWIDDGGDSGTSTYLMFGLPMVALSLACLAEAAFILRRR